VSTTVQTNAMRHLNDDEFAEAMMGAELKAEAQAHVDACAECRAEIAKFEDSVGDFGVASLRWSESLPAYRTSYTPGKVSTPAQRFFPVAAWALAAAVLLGVMVPVTVHFEHGHSSVETAANAGDDFASGDSAEQIAKDNALMAAVNDELSQSEASMLAAHNKAGMRERRR
jgi:hypothetical protein